MCVLSINVPIRKMSGNLFNDIRNDQWDIPINVHRYGTYFCKNKKDKKNNDSNAVQKVFIKWRLWSLEWFQRESIITANQSRTRNIFQYYATLLIYIILWECLIKRHLPFIILLWLAQSPGAVEYADCTSAEG